MVETNFIRTSIELKDLHSPIQFTGSLSSIQKMTQDTVIILVLAVSSICWDLIEI